MFQYAALYTFGLWCFWNLESTALRASALGLLFPGAGLVAVGTIPAIVAFVVTMVGIPVTLFVWFAMGGVLFPLMLWFGSAILAGLIAKDTLFDQAGSLWAAVCVLLITWAIWKSSAINARGRSIQQQRNRWLPSKVQSMLGSAVKAPEPGSRELDLRTLRFVQHMIERGLTKHNDLSYHDVIDQFQTGAVRYQLYGVVDSIGLYLTHYAPGFHGYAAEACRNSIEKSLTKRIMSYWKWERLTGKFTTDYDPINYDNIMVSYDWIFAQSRLLTVIRLLATWVSPLACTPPPPATGATRRRALWTSTLPTGFTTSDRSVTWPTRCMTTWPPTIIACTHVSPTGRTLFASKSLFYDI